ncbi:hypothetical protein [Sporichthya sp.]|uniref:hypothetical protein n=1 Tax=Sporichthya sp. TaxID=65475 RepID=UPI0018435F1F|nr:hypothetical protein [Sporichthya sp.]MBA3743499.1 hypothetical protein [Sporichthya sp.]
MATNRKRRTNSITNLLGDVIDDTKDLVDDALDRAKDVEHDVRRGARRVVDGDSGSSRSRAKAEPVDEVDSLKAAIEELTAKVNRLATLRGENGSSTR